MTYFSSQHFPESASVIVKSEMPDLVSSRSSQTPRLSLSSDGESVGNIPNIESTADNADGQSNGLSFAAVRTAITLLHYVFTCNVALK